ncbi:hypothetical protein [Serratia sp. M24T3]|uniref:hypothetical protein n=1 Tax=Serratia sp. M24T3 TaxID=932213 RepID=UPI00025B9645|nr:hypothetical protein [Serratia sp. M24T3]EIC83913.1 hypothetical protein SPM24T3_14426 [Serratia sp. M24T3]
MPLSSSSNINIKNYPGYTEINTIKKNYSNKTNIVKCVDSVKNKAYLLPESNSSFTVPFIPVDTSITVYEACETPVKQPLPSPATKIFAAVSVMMLLGSGAAFTMNRSSRSGADGGEDLPGAQSFAFNGPPISAQDTFYPMNHSSRSVVDKVEDISAAQHIVAHPNISRPANPLFGTFALGNRGFNMEVEARQNIALDMIKQFNQAVGRPNALNKRTQLKKITNAINQMIEPVINDFNDTINQNSAWLKTELSPKNKQIETRVNRLKSAKDEVIKLQDGINKIEKAPIPSVKVKVNKLISLFENFTKKNSNESAETPQNLVSLSKSLGAVINSLQILIG